MGKKNELPTLGLPTWSALVTATWGCVSGPPTPPEDLGEACTTAACPSDRLDRCDDFHDPTLSTGWNVVYGEPTVGPPGCQLSLACDGAQKAEIQSVAPMLFGSLSFEGARVTSWDEEPAVATDTYFGWQVFDGDCHSAVVVDDGTLAILSQTAGSDCAQDPVDQCYLPIPQFEQGMYSGLQTWELAWSAAEVRLIISGAVVLLATEVQCGFPMPAVPMYIDLSCNLDGQMVGEHAITVQRIIVDEGSPFETSGRR